LAVTRELIQCFGRAAGYRDQLVLAASCHVFLGM
jgi:hypothetical protein